MKSTQEAFTKIVLHLRRQGERSLDNGACVYRGENGRSCAIGCIIADEHYTEALEGTVLKNPDRHGTWQRSGALFRALKASGWDVSNKTLEMLCAMQAIHDAIDVADWESRFTAVAKGYGLELPQ